MSRKLRVEYPGAIYHLMNPQSSLMYRDSFCFKKSMSACMAFIWQGNEKMQRGDRPRFPWERRTPNVEHRTPNVERRTSNAERPINARARRPCHDYIIAALSRCRL